MREALWRKIRDKIQLKVVNRDEDSSPDLYSWGDVQYAIKLTVEEMRKHSHKTSKEKEE